MKMVISQLIAFNRRRRLQLLRLLQRRFWLVLVFLSVLQSCNHVDTAERRVVLIFVDMSLSTLSDRENYKHYIEKVISNLKPGDRLAVGKIIDLTIADFTPIVDKELPSFNFWTDNRTLHHRLVDGITTRMYTNIDSLLEIRTKIEKTEIISSFLICEQFMRNKSGRKSLIILSDMLECSAEFNFERDELTPEYIEQAIRSLKEKGRIPRLDHVEVWIAGASAKTTEQYFAVQSFWNRFLQETGSTPRSYSHALLDFE